MKNKNDFIDIILPNFNEAEYLKDAIESVVNQTFLNWKLYIIDDCSTDNSHKVLKIYEFCALNSFSFSFNLGTTSKASPTIP